MGFWDPTSMTVCEAELSQNAIYYLIFTSLHSDPWRVIALEVPRINTLKAEEFGMEKLATTL